MRLRDAGPLYGRVCVTPCDNQTGRGVERLDRGKADVWAGLLVTALFFWWLWLWMRRK